MTPFLIVGTVLTFSGNRCTKKIKFSNEYFYNKCDQIRRKLPIWSYLLRYPSWKASVCAVNITHAAADMVHTLHKNLVVGGILEHFGTEKAILELKVTKISYVRMMAIILYDGYDFVSMI